MNMKYYNASNNFSAPIQREPKPYRPYEKRSEVIVPQRPERREQHVEKKEDVLVTTPKREFTLNSLKTDDLLLLGIIILLFLDGCDDYLLLLVLGYLFFVGLDQK